MTTLRIPCPECGRGLKLPDRSLLGRKGRCPACGHKFVLEAPPEQAEPSSSLEPATAGSRRWKRRHVAAIAGAGVVGLVAVVVIILAGRGASSPVETAKGGAAGIEAVAGKDSRKPQAATTLPAARVVVGAIRVDTTPPGFHVLIDFEPARTAEGELAVTPCLVEVPTGAHSVMVVREGHRDESRQVSVPAKRSSEWIEVNFGSLEKGISQLLGAPLFGLEPGRPVPLASLNTPAAERDPWLSGDALAVWYVGGRPGGQAVYFATRPSPFHAFDTAEAVPASRSRDRRASPSVTRDGLLIYADPDKAFLWSLARSSPLGPFDDKQPIASTSKTSPVWNSAQVLVGGLEAYWTERVGKAITSWKVTRPSPDAEFGKPQPADLPGKHPCLSPDGLRQYVLTGTTLVRWRRDTRRGKFRSDGEVVKLELDGYQSATDSRQFFVSADEQWMVYCDDPRDGGGDLSLVRLSEGAGWGPRPIAGPAPPKQEAAVAAVTPDPRPAAGAKLKLDPMSDKPAEVEPEPKAEGPPPLPYTVYLARFRKLLADRRYEMARVHLAAAKGDRDLAGQAEQVAWDAEDLGAIEAFWKDVTRSLEKLKPGDEVRIGSVKLKFVGIEEGQMVARSKTDRVTRKLTALAPGDVVLLAEGTVTREDQPGQLRIGTFLYYDVKGRSRSARRRFDRAGERGKEFIERQGRRILVQANAEIERDNLAAALPLLTMLSTLFGRTTAAAEVPAVRENLYSLEKWTRVGSRNWQVDGQAITAGTKRVAGAKLVSPGEFSRFELTLEWKTEGETGQGGVFFRFPGSGRPLKLQLSSDFGVSADSFSTGALFGIEAPGTNAVKPTGEWNTLRLKVEGERVRVTINGRGVLETTVSDPKLPLRGQVALDGAIGGISYRNVLLVRLPPEPDSGR